ncbi:hypothetical protein YC2023_098137 [Brassica napus]
MAVEEREGDERWREIFRCCGPVDEMERSEEQFVKEMEVTRRNSEPASQVMALWGVGGETVVAWVFDDSRALGCCGSNGKEEVQGVREVRGTGEMVEKELERGKEH